MPKRLPMGPGSLREDKDESVDGTETAVFALPTHSPDRQGVRSACGSERSNVHAVLRKISLVKGSVINARMGKRGGF